MKKRYVFQALLLLCLTACGSKDEFDATGTFEATEIVVSSEATGKLFYLNAEEGMHFTQGTEVGLIDTVQLYLKKRQLEAQMKSVESQRPDIHRQIAATKAQIATAQRERDRVENCLKHKLPTANNWMTGIHSWRYSTDNWKRNFLRWAIPLPA